MYAAEAEKKRRMRVAWSGSSLGIMEKLRTLFHNGWGGVFFLAVVILSSDA
jgi:hypothetical protein